MTTVVNNPAPTSGNGDSGMGMVIGIIVVILVVILLVLFGLPALRGGGGTDVPDTNAPAGGGTEINIPDKVDVNVKYGQ
jgi:predicted metalloprotease